MQEKLLQTCNETKFTHTEVSSSIVDVSNSSARETVIRICPATSRDVIRAALTSPLASSTLLSSTEVYASLSTPCTPVCSCAAYLGTLGNSADEFLVGLKEEFLTGDAEISEREGFLRRVDFLRAALSLLPPLQTWETHRTAEGSS